MSDKGAFIWYELMTDDPAGAKAFYDAVVGWTVEAEGSPMPTGTEYRMIGRSDGGAAGGVLTISDDMRRNGAKPVWLGYIHSPDVDADVAAIVAAGGKVHMPATDLAVGRIAMASDPQGAVIYLMNPVPPSGQPDAKSDVFDYAKAEHVRWNELWTSDPDAAIALYTRLFGWTQEGDMDMGPMGKYRFLYREGGMIGAVGRAQPGGDGSRWDFYIGVDDIDRAARAVKVGGGRLTGDIQQIPGGDYSVRVRDPQGAGFGLVGPRKGA
jgi:predicted enzyme related to lactoylglutathione lyase